MTDLLISCLCVTEGRPAFMPWLLWCFDRQRWPRRELVIVDGSSEASPFPDRDDVCVIRVPAGTSIGAKRNRALEAARGAIITWFDDDDWQHPEKLSRLASSLGSGALAAGPSTGWFVDLSTGQCAPHSSPAGHIVFNGAGFLREPALSVRFREDVARGSDSHWMLELAARHPGQTAVLNGPPLFWWLCHQWNISNPARGKQLVRPLSDLKSVLGEDAWADTDVALDALRHRLDETRRDPSLHAAIERAIVNAPDSHPNGKAAAACGQPARRVSACLLSWKRPQNLQQIVDSLHGHDFIDEILVWNNNPEVHLTLVGSKVRVIPSRSNLVCYGRFACAAQARNEIIYVQDDDVIVQNLPALYRQFLGDDTRITHTLSEQHYQTRERCHYAEAHVALLGWGSFFQKPWLNVLDTCVQKFGSDPLFLREADKFFTILLRRRHNTLPGDLRYFADSNTPGLALWRDPDHELYKSLAVRRALQVLRESKSVRYPITWNVVIPCHNYGRYLHDAVRSVLTNDADFVVTIVDDASTDQTPDLCREFARKYDHVSWIRLDENAGVSHARNRGIAAVDSLFVVLLDADDYLGPNYLYEAEKLLRSGADVVNTDAILFGTSLGRWPVPKSTSLAMLLQRNSVHYCSAFQRSYWAQAGGFDEEMLNWEDYEFWIRVAKLGARIRGMSGDHFYYRQHAPSRSRQAEQIKPQLWNYITRKHRDLFSAAREGATNPRTAQ